MASAPDDAKTAIDKFLDSVPFLKKNKTYFAAFGLFAYAAWQGYSGDIPGAVQTGLSALGLLGLRHAISKV